MQYSIPKFITRVLFLQEKNKCPLNINYQAQVPLLLFLKLSLQLRWDRQFEQKNLISNGIFRIVSCMFPQTIVGCSKHLYLIFVVGKILCLILTLIWILDIWNQLVFFWRYGVDERLREFIYMTSPGSPSLLALCCFHTAFCTL